MPSSPHVTVFIPAYNSAAYIRETIDSVLSQDYDNFDILVVDDASTDASCEAVLSFPQDIIRLERFPHNTGALYATNFALRAAKGEYFCRLDADDLFVPGRLRTQVAFMEANPELLACGGLFVAFSEDGTETVSTKPTGRENVAAFCCFSNPITHSTSMVRVAMQRKLNLWYNPGQYRTCGDYDFWMRASLVAPIDNMTEVLCRYRLHPQQMTAKNDMRIPSIDHIRSVLLSHFMEADPRDVFLHNFACQILAGGASRFVFSMTELERLATLYNQIMAANAKKRIYSQESLAGSLNSLFSAARMTLRRAHAATRR